MTSQTTNVANTGAHTNGKAASNGSNAGSSVATGAAVAAGVSGTNGSFKVYGSLFKVDSRYQFLNPLGKGSYGIVW